MTTRRRDRCVARTMIAAAALTAAGVPGPARAQTGPDPGAEVQPIESGGPIAHLKFFPVPMYTTVPTEGSTYGLMPVVLGVNEAGVVRIIGAPSVSWNSAAGVNGTLRFYYYPSPVRALSVIAAASTHVNRTLWVTYTDLPVEMGRATLETDAMIRRNIFFRFFGLGPDSMEENQSSYTRTTALATARWGWNFPYHLNLGARGTIRHDNPIRNPIFGLPATQDLFPTAPGINGAGVVAGELSLRFDTRPVAEYSRAGLAAELRAGYDDGLSAFDQFFQITGQVRGLIEENPDVQGAARFYWTREFGGGDNVPFYYQAILGGDSLLRGFPDDRFIDRGAWELEIEQRIHLFDTHMFGVSTAWRVDPFLAIGQVYGPWSDIVSHVRLSGGAGLRAWVRPNVLGRVDVAYAGEGINAYVVLGYPY